MNAPPHPPVPSDTRNCTHAPARADEEEEVAAEELEEWGVGAMAGNPDEQASGAPPCTLPAPLRRPPRLHAPARVLAPPLWACMPATRCICCCCLPLLLLLIPSPPRSPTLSAPAQIPLLPDATRRLAVVDLDWAHIRAVDILAVLRSFAPQARCVGGRGG